MNLELLYSHFLKHPKIYTDSRKVTKNSIFFALKGKKYNGNLFAEEALEKGAKIVVVDQKIKNDTRFFYVKNSLICLQELAKKHRENLKIPIIGITGTNGKTSTKEFISLLLSSSFNVAYTKGNLNNHIGVPLTILKINNNHTIGVVEFGANKKGDIKELCEIAKPTHGLITNVGKAHLQDFISLENIINTKTELWVYLMENNGIIFFNTDDKLLTKKAKKIFKESVIQRFQLYGENIKTEKDIKLLENSHFLNFKYNGSIINTKIVGKYNLINIMAAIKVATYFQITAKKIKKVLPIISIKNRSEFIKTKKNEIVLDAYNANPYSMNIAIKNFLEIENYKDNEKIIILGDMLELGKQEIQEHEKIIRLLEKSNIPQKNIFLIGTLFLKTKNNYFKKFKNKDEIISFLKDKKLIKKLILIKGSRKMELEKLLKKV